MKHYTIKELLSLLKTFNLEPKCVYINNSYYNYKIYNNIFFVEKQTYYNKNLTLQININTNKILTNTLTIINKFKFDCFDKSTNMIIFESEENYNHILAKPISYFNIKVSDNTIVSSLNTNSTLIHKNYDNPIQLDYYTPIEDINKTLNNLIFI